MKFGLKPFFRMSTLVDPLQPIEKVEKRSLNLLKFFNKYEIPVVINTKSDLLSESPWVDEILKLSEKGLVVVQLTIPFKDEDAAKLEPFVPRPSKRWKAAEALSESGVPIAIRTQPLIPNVNGDQVYFEEIIKRAKDAKARPIIIELLRVLGRNNLEIYRKIFGDRLNEIKWVKIWKPAG